MRYSLRLTEAQHSELRAHLFPGDGNEAVAILLCGRREGESRHIFTVRKIVTVPYDLCDRHPHRVTWPTSFVEQLVMETWGKRQAIIKVHCHPNGCRQFSTDDNTSNRTLFASVTSLLGDGMPHASVIMLPKGEMFGRVLGDDGKVVGAIDSITTVGADICIYPRSGPAHTPEFAKRHAQAFGRGTTELLRGLAVAVIGCSGTGSIVAEQLARLGVGRLVLVDPDTVEEKNLNRILNAGMEDAYLRRPKVSVLASAIARMGLGQSVRPLHTNLIDPAAVRAVAECDAVFGCMDGAEGRHMLNRLATFYTIPYVDVGVRLDADGNGGIAAITGAVHYLQPGKSSLHSRGVYNMERVEAEEMRRTDPEMYRRQVKEGYLRGVNEDRPAVISVNMFFASLAVNDFLARLHPYRNHSNADYACISGNLCETQLFPEGEATHCDMLQRHVGRGDVTPLLERPSLS